MFAIRPLAALGPTAVLAILTISFPARAQSYVRADCKPVVTAGAPADALTAHWYRRFWTGDCTGLHGCMAGSPNWNDVVSKLVARSRAQERPAVLARACRLGPLIGLEWTRPRTVRRIDSRDLRKFKTTLESSGDVLKGIERVEAEARAKIGSRG